MMKTTVLAFAGGLALMPAAFAAQFEPYPEATLSDELTKEVHAELAKARPRARLLYGDPKVYTTMASFEEVLAFYKKLGAKEFMLATPWTTGPHEENVPAEMIDGAPPGGMTFKKAILILDDASEPYKSTCWVEISYPLAGKKEGEKIGGIEKVTGITYVKKKEPLD
jgi:hypothetical protein